MGTAKIVFAILASTMLAIGLSACFHSDSDDDDDLIFTDTDILSLKFGDTFSQKAEAIAVDSVGNIFIVGTFTGNIDFGGGNLDAVLSDVFVAKFDAEGNHLWSRKFGGTGDDFGIDIAVNSIGDVFVFGEFESTRINFGRLGDELDRRGVVDTFIARLNGVNGSHAWSRNQGRVDATTRAAAVAVDPFGEVIIGGSFSGASTDLGNGELANQGGSDVFVARYSPNIGTHLFSAGYGDSNDQQLSDLAADSAASMLLLGSFTGTINFGGTDLTAVSANPDIFVVSLDSSGNHQASKAFGGSGSESPQAVAVDGSDNIVIVGAFEGSIDFGGAVLNASSMLDSNYFVARFDESLNHAFSDGYGDSELQVEIDVATDSRDNIVIGGSLVGSVDFGGGALTSAGGRDVLFALLSPNGSHIKSDNFGDADNQDLAGIAAVGSQRYLMTGFFDGAIDFGRGALISNGEDVFLGSVQR